MIANKKFLNLPLDFWANIRFISQEKGYTNKSSIKVHTIDDIISVYKSNSFKLDKILDSSRNITPFAQLLLDYFDNRSMMLHNSAEKNLLVLQEAKDLYLTMVDQYSPTWLPAMNKQKGEKAGPNYFTGIINILLEHYSKGYDLDYNPRKLTVLTDSLSPSRTLSRRVDGAFPSVVNPIAIWEIKEYYFTTTFGSRIADGVYETQLDGSELKEARDSLEIDVFHYLMVDAYDTWWKMGKSYLCRMCDMLHMGITSEVLFGKEVVERLPILIPSWIEKYNSRSTSDI